MASEPLALRETIIPVRLLLLLCLLPSARAETPDEAKRRHDQVAERRERTNIICHRGSSEVAHENTLEAFRSTFELGADGNEFDLRITKDGVLVVFHDDMLDHLLDAYGDVSEVTWAELQQFRFREPGRFGDQCRIPTVVEVFELQRRHAGLMYLDIKVKGIDQAVSDLLTKMDLWDHVIACNNETGGVILKDPRYKPLRFKGALYQDRGEVFPEAIATVLKKPGEAVMVDDPRGTALALGRKFGTLSTEPVASRPVPKRVGPPRPVEADLLAILRNADDWDKVADTPADQLASGERIRKRARAAEDLLAQGEFEGSFARRRNGCDSEACTRTDVPRVRRGDGAASSGAQPDAAEVARFGCGGRPKLEPVIDPRW